MNKLICFILVLFTVTFSSAQNGSFDKSQWNKLRNGIKYKKKAGGAKNYSNGGSTRKHNPIKNKSEGRNFGNRKLQDIEYLSEPGDYEYGEYSSEENFNDKYWKDVDFDEDEREFNEFIQESKNSSKYKKSEDASWNKLKENHKGNTPSNYSDNRSNYSKKRNSNWFNNKKGKDINVVEEDKYELPDLDKENLKDSKISGGTSAAGMSMFLKVILITLLVVIVSYIAYKIYLNYLENKSIKSEKTVEITEDITPIQIPKSALQKALEEAIARKDYREAVRVYFIFIIKDLSEKNWINWEKEKTNYSYLREMQARSEFQDFSESVNIFEIVWYGKREITDKDFKSVQPTFVNLLNKLGVK